MEKKRIIGVQDVKRLGIAVKSVKLKTGKNIKMTVKNEIKIHLL